MEFNSLYFYFNKKSLKSFQPIAIFPGKYEWAGKPSTGDCSLKIKSAEIKFDDGNWVCQVTGTSFQNQDNLASEPARLVVRGEFQIHSVKYFIRNFSEGCKTGSFDSISNSN